MPPRKSPLRAVTAGEKSTTRRRPLTVASAAESGTPRDLLVAMRRQVAKAVDSANTSPRDLAALTKRLQDIAKEIEAIDARSEQEGEGAGSVPDEPFDASVI
jgi:hypothetical protein